MKQQTDSLPHESQTLYEALVPFRGRLSSILAPFTDRKQRIQRLLHLRDRVKAVHRLLVNLRYAVLNQPMDCVTPRDGLPNRPLVLARVNHLLDEMCQWTACECCELVQIAHGEYDALERTYRSLTTEMGRLMHMERIKDREWNWHEDEGVYERTTRLNVEISDLEKTVLGFGVVKLDALERGMDTVRVAVDNIALEVRGLDETVSRLRRS